MVCLVPRSYMYSLQPVPSALSEAASDTQDATGPAPQNTDALSLAPPVWAPAVFS